MVTQDSTRTRQLIEAIRSASPLLKFGEFELELCGTERLSDTEFEELQDNCDDVRIERTAEGVLRVGGPAGDFSDRLEDRLRDIIKAWIAAQGAGMTFGSNAGAYLPSGSAYTPDLSWRPPEQIPPPGDTDAWMAPRYGVAPFIVEIQSNRQSVPFLRRKMSESIVAGAQLGWLILPRSRTIEIYRPGQAVEVLADPATLSGEDVMPGLVVDMSDVWP